MHNKTKHRFAKKQGEITILLTNSRSCLIWELVMCFADTHAYLQPTDAHSIPVPDMVWVENKILYAKHASLWYRYWKGHTHTIFYTLYNICCIQLHLPVEFTSVNYEINVSEWSEQHQHYIYTIILGACILHIYTLCVCVCLCRNGTENWMTFCSFFSIIFPLFFGLVSQACKTY